MSRALPLVIVLCSCGRLHADGGMLRWSEEKAGYRITVFTAPTPLRAGPVDVSVFLQDAATGEPIPQARIAVRLTPRGRPSETLDLPATEEAATNKLFQAAVFKLPESGWWDGEIIVEGPREPIRVHFEMEAAEPLPRWRQLWPWIAWPAVMVLLFAVHQWMVRLRRLAANRMR